MRLPPRILNHPLLGRWNWIRNGNPPHFQSQRRVPRQNYGNLLSRPLTQSVRHRRRTLQRHPLCSSIGRERRRMHGHWQRSPLWYMFQNFETHHPHLWRLEPLSFCCHVRSHLLSQIPRSIELWFEKVGCQPDPLPTSPFLHGWIRPPHLQRIPIIQSFDRPWAHPTNVRRQEYDVRRWPQTRKISHRLRPLQRKNVHQGSRRTNVERLKQELFLLRRMDP